MIFTKQRTRAQVFQTGAAGVAHAGAQSAHQLVNDIDQRSLVRDAAFNSFRHQLVAIAHALLEIAILGAVLHGPQRTHAPVALVRPALVELDLSGRFVGARQQPADHDAVGACGNRLGDVPGKADPAVGDQRHIGPAQCPGDVADRGNLRYPDPGHHPGGTDRARADPHLDPVGAVLDEVQRRAFRGDIAGNNVHGSVLPLDIGHALEHAAGVSVRGVDHDDIDLGRDQPRDPFVGIRPHADRGRDQQPPVLILTGIGMLGGLLDVLDGDQAPQVERVVHDQDFFDTVLVQQRLDLVARRTLVDRHQPIPGRHHAAHRRVVAGLEAQVTAGDDSGQLVVVDDRNAGNPVMAGEIQNFLDGGGRGDRDRVLDDTAFVLLDLADFAGLTCRGQVAVDHAQAACLGETNRGAGFGDGVHGCRQQGNIQ